MKALRTVWRHYRHVIRSEAPLFSTGEKQNSRRQTHCVPITACGLTLGAVCPAFVAPWTVACQDVIVYNNIFAIHTSENDLHVECIL